MGTAGRDLAACIDEMLRQPEVTKKERIYLETLSTVIHQKGRSVTSLTDQEGNNVLPLLANA